MHSEEPLMRGDIRDMNMRFQTEYSANKKTSEVVGCMFYN